MLFTVLRRNLSLTTGLLKKNSALKNNFCFKPIKKDHYKDVLKHLETSFYVDEPMSKAAKLTKGGKNPDLENFVISTLDENMSIMALTEDKQVAGVMLNAQFRSADKDKYKERILNCETEAFKKIAVLMYHLSNGVDMFDKFSVDVIFDARILSVAEPYRRYTLGRELLQQSTIIAQKSNFPLVKIEASGLYSQKALEKLGFRTLNEIFYSQYVDDTGKPVLAVKPPHTSIKLMYKELGVNGKAHN